jgi:hypothetical protein
VIHAERTRIELLFGAQKTNLVSRTDAGNGPVRAGWRSLASDTAFYTLHRIHSHFQQNLCTIRRVVTMWGGQEIEVSWCQMSSLPEYPRYNDAVLGVIATSALPFVIDFARGHHRKAVAARAVDLIDLDRGELGDRWGDLDQPRVRAKALSWSPGLWEACADSLRPQLGSFNTALNQARLRQLNWSPLRKYLLSWVPAAVNRNGNSIQRERVFPELWPLVGDELARRLYAANRCTFTDPEWRYLNGMLLCGFFAGCRLTTASLVEQALAEGRQWRPLGLRGVFVRVPEQICPKGIADRPPAVARRSGGVALRHAALSPLLAAIHAESQAVPAGRGALHEIMPLQGPSRELAGFYHPLPPSQRAAALDKSFRLTEYNLLAYLALAGIEQLLRGWATHQGRQHLKPNGQPRGVLEWLQRELRPTPELMVLSRELYDADGSNIRNRVMHGNLTEVEAKRLEAYMAALHPDAIRLSAGCDPYHPENLAQLCLDCLERIDAEVTSAVGRLAPDDFSWTTNLALTPEEIQFGNAQPIDFLEPDGEQYLGNMKLYLEAICPGLMPY